MECFVIRLNDLKFYSRIGVMDQERVVGNEFVVDVEIRYPADQFSFSMEDLCTTISYADVYEMVACRMAQSWMLLESVAKAMSDDLHERYPPDSGSGCNNKENLGACAQHGWHRFNNPVVMKPMSGLNVNV